MDVRLASCSLASVWLFLAVCIGTLKGVLPVCINDIGSLSSELVSLGGPATEVQLQCSALGSYKWWRSNSCQTTTFTEYNDCNTQQICTIPLSSLMEEFFIFFCCTPDDVFFFVAAESPKCFQIKLCPEITDFVVPPIVFVGSQEKVYISVQASPPPPSQHLRIILESDRRDIDLTYSTVEESGIPNSTYVHIFDVPLDVPQGAVIMYEATLSLDTCSQVFVPKMTQKILNNSLPSSCAVSSSSSLTVPSSTAVMVLPTPSPTPDSCPTTSCTAAVLGPTIPLTVIIAFLLCVIFVLIIVIPICWFVHRKRYVYATSSNGDPSRSRPSDLPINGNGALPQGPNSPHYATVSNVSTPYTPYTPPHQEHSLLMSTSPPQRNPEGVYGRTHDGNTMILTANGSVSNV